MATLAPQPDPQSSSRRRPRSWARRCERICWSCLTTFPLVFVYGLTTWAAWVQAHLGFMNLKGSWVGNGSAFLGITLWALLNWSYTVAVFTDPGSTLSRTHNHSSLPSHDPTPSSLTVKSSGGHRFCKKCQSRKPDRAHHCSSCKRCVLKMDHHCPWLATCVGLRNYKPFVLFLVYTCLFCDVCFLVSGAWIWDQTITGGSFDTQEGFMPVQYVLLCALAGIIGLVLTGFTGWHIYLATQGQTTIESLEKTRYLTPLRKSMQHQSNRQYVGEDPQPPSPRLIDQITEAHANALPGVTRPEEGEDERGSPAQQSLNQNYSDLEARHEHDRYQAYLDEQASDKLPNAFDHGWKANLLHVFGRSPQFWILPVINTTGDGWNWQPSARWNEAREDLAKERRARQRENAAFADEERGLASRTPVVDFRGNGPLHQGLKMENGTPTSAHSMRSLPPRESHRPRDAREEDGQERADSDDDDDDGNDDRKHLLPARSSTPKGQWNDLPSDIEPRRASSRDSRSPRPARAYPQG